MTTLPAAPAGSVLPASLAAQARELSSLIGQRLADPDAVASVTQHAEQQSGFPFAFGGPSLGNGFGGLALLHWYLARAADDDGHADRWRRVAHREIRSAAESTRAFPVASPGLIDGSAGFAYVLSDCARDEPRYGRTLHALNDNLAGQVLALPWPQDGAGLRAESYDVIGGAAGVLNYLCRVPEPSEPVRAAVTTLVRYLVWLGGQPEPASPMPRWFIGPDCFPLPEYRQQYPHGYLNSGLSHGVPGPLGALATAWQHGHRVDGQLEAIRHMASWLQRVAQVDEWGPSWPNGVPITADGRQQVDGADLSRAGWCYGSPGVAATLWTAGQALADTELQRMAVRAIEAVLERPTGLARVFSPTLCHGIAGVLAVVDHLARVDDNDALRRHLPELVSRIVAAADPGAPLGIRDEEIPGRLVDSPGVLTGAAGVALALLAVTSDPPPDWYRAFLIA